MYSSAIWQRIKRKIKAKEGVATIGRWSYDYCKHLLNVDDDFQYFLTDLGGMSADPQFERSYEELDKIADKLIAGETVKLYP